MDATQVAILKAAALGGAHVEMRKNYGAPTDDSLECVIQGGHEALALLQGNAAALEELTKVAPVVLEAYDMGGALPPLTAELVA